MTVDLSEIRKVLGCYFPKDEPGVQVKDYAIQLLDEVEQAVRDSEYANQNCMEAVMVTHEQKQEITRFRDALETYPWEYVRAIHAFDDDMLREWLAKRSKALASAALESKP